MKIKPALIATVVTVGASGFGVVLVLAPEISLLAISVVAVWAIAYAVAGCD